ncbi:MAG TPA: hypothetical protein VHZ03_04755 [Trebonia sp.]|jgi:hypothetical protein|nr:hypothetical protein [Trebonia sp.]
MWPAREDAEKTAARWRDCPLDAWLDNRWSCTVSDPPPLAPSRAGQAYFLAHFNAHRAIYSSEPPPGEQAASP